MMRPLRAIVLLMGLCGATLSGAERYVVGVENIDYFPQYAFSYRGSYAEAVLSRFAVEEDVQLLYSPEPIVRLYKGLLETGALDFKYPDSPEWARGLKEGQQVYYSEPLSEYIDGVYVLPERLGLGLSKFRTLGLLHGFTPVAFEALIREQKVRLIVSSDLGELLLMCLRGEIDGVYANMDLSHHWLTHTIKKPYGLVFDSSLPFDRGFYRLSSVRHPQMIERFNAFLQRNQDVLAKLRANYGIVDKPRALGPEDF